MDEQNKIVTIDDLMADLTGKNPPPPQPPNPQQIPQGSALPPRPPAPAPATSAPISPRPSSPVPPPPAPAPRPASSNIPQPGASSRVPQAGSLAPAPTMPSSAGAMKEYQSSLRTMSDDIAKIKSGQKLSGMEVQKRITAVQQRPQSSAPSPAASGRPLAGIPATGQPTEKSSATGTLRQSSDASKPTYVSGEGLRDDKGRVVAHERAPVTNEIPKPSFLSQFIPLITINKRVFLLVAGGMLLAGISYFALQIINQEPEVVIQTVTPRPVRTPVAQQNISASFGTISSYNYATPDLTTQGLYAAIASQSINPGQFQKFPVIEGAGTESLSFIGLLEALAQGYPAELKDQLASDSLSLIYSQREVYNDSGARLASASLNRLVLIAEIKDLAAFNQTLTVWMPKIAANLAPILNLDKTAAANPRFSQTTYSDILIRYANFPHPDRTIDYAVVPGSNRKNYFVVTNSREAIFAAIDRLRGR